MSRRTVAEARRSQLVTTFGVGALFPAQDESFMIVGLDDWQEFLCPVVPEPRLAQSLGVHTFRLPPSGSSKGQDLPVIRFPRIHHCPACHRLGTLNRFGSWDENVHKECSRKLTPSRFVVCCTNGHIDDFPYFAWVHRGQVVHENAQHQLSLRTRGQSSSLNDIVVSCSCGVQPRSMAGSFGPKALQGIRKCTGERPWLRTAPAEECDEVPRTLQRGSSNVWFAVQRSALSIPPWSEGVMKVVGNYWPALEHVPAEALAPVLKGMQIPKSSGLSVDELIAAILEMRGEGEQATPTEADLRSEEYQALVLGRPEVDPHQQFVCEPVEGLADAASDLIARVSEVSRLREVRALQGFRRVTPGEDGGSSDRLSKLSYHPATWLPAIEVLGEGVFLRLREDVVSEWEESQFARQRAAAINDAYDMRAQQFGAGNATEISPRELLLHSFAHVLLTELSLDAGYPVASLRERVYAGPGQTGVLVYTASADSAGSLGGLSAQADPERIWGVLQSAIHRARWCSSDPVCIESSGSGADALNLSACHACLLLPETSCERMNHVLDRATLVGLPGRPEEGFFHQFIN
ncbi:DUF1998 domain-containing protein [Nocardioides koreensis]|uniref:DUF1998 domain-containing protein n=1 Tax=Nocardioides koreensis TaxID=433651 RepID=A0ABN2ZT21_9ACTN